VGAVTKALNRIAMENGVVVVCLAQLNRQSVVEGNREPRLSDLRDSGDIEQDADRVVFIHRPDECPITKRRQDTLDTLSDLPRYGCALVQAKGRNVGTAYGAALFSRKLARFEF
jgi:replicative DNA helicase